MNKEYWAVTSRASNRTDRLTANTSDVKIQEDRNESA